MLTIENITVDDRIADIHFACDLAACKGACCTLKGGRGAPVSDAEVDEIYKAYPIVKKYLSSEHLEWIENHGLVEGVPGFYATQCIEEEACVFVHYENGVAKCSFEKAFHNKEIEWRKPLSCHLFPLRANYGQKTELRFEYLKECEPAFKRGGREGIVLFKFLKDVLIRACGKRWYEMLNAECGRRSSIHQISE